jgi:hypothetical protein
MQGRQLDECSVYRGWGVRQDSERRSDPATDGEHLLVNSKGHVSEASDRLVDWETLHYHADHG